MIGVPSGGAGGDGARRAGAGGDGASPDGDRSVVLHLRGEIDFFTEDEFRAEAERLLADSAAERLVVDLAEVSSMDSSGLGLLVDLLRLCQDMELSMAIRHVPGAVVHLLDMTGLNRVITIE